MASTDAPDVVSKASKAADVEAAIQRAIPAEGVMNGVRYRVESRTWFVGGKYLGRDAPFLLCEVADVVRSTTGHYYGEWQGTRFVDGADGLRNTVDRETAMQERLIRNAGYDPAREFHGFPYPLADWGEMRIVTFGLADQPDTAARAQ